MCTTPIFWAFKQDQLTGAERFVLIALANHANKALVCWPSLQTIGKFTGLSRRKVAYCLRQLESYGLIKTALRHEKNQQRSSFYTLVGVHTVQGDPAHGADLALHPVQTEPPTEPPNEPKKNQTLDFKGKVKRKPRHGQRTRDGKRVWLDVETDDFKAYIQDQGNTPLLWNGSGAWFAYY